VASFATLAIFTYSANWAKPKDVDIPVQGGKFSCLSNYPQYRGESFVERSIRPSKERSHSLTSSNNHRIPNDTIRLQSHETRFLTLSNTLAISTACFGSTHCAAWFSDFPSQVERLLWLITSALSATLPVSNLVMVASTNITLRWRQPTLLHQMKKMPEKTYPDSDSKSGSQTMLFCKDSKLWANCTMKNEVSRVPLRNISWHDTNALTDIGYFHSS
jgi:hypothetical protein